MFSKIIRFFGFRGSWKWACKQMDKGKIVRCKSWTGTVRLKIDNKYNRRIIWAFPNRKDPYGLLEKWESANIFLSDFEATDWEVVGE